MIISTHTDTLKELATQDLWLELSRCAAMCYKRGGRWRNAALLRAEVADALASRGSVREAVSLLGALAQEVLAEGWLHLAAALLQRLLHCSRPLTAVRCCPCLNTLPLGGHLHGSFETSKRLSVACGDCNRVRRA